MKFIPKSMAVPIFMIASVPQAIAVNYEVARNSNNDAIRSLSGDSDSVALQWVPAPPFQVWQYEHFGDDWNNPLIAGPDRDPDGDGWTNEDEWITGTIVIPLNSGGEPRSFYRVAVSRAP